MKNNKKKKAETIISFYRSKINTKSENLFAVCETLYENNRNKPYFYFPFYGNYQKLCDWLKHSLESTIKKYLRADLKDGYRIEITLYKEGEK